MSAHVVRAQLLLAQSRPADAEQESMLALAAQPDDVSALSLLALSRSAQQKNDGALDAVRTAIGLAPDNAYLHYVLALVLHRLNREPDARRAIQEALRLDPGQAEHFSLLASIELGARNWPAALAAAEDALRLDPEHVNAANLRAMALVRLGRKEEAMQSVDYALHREPDNAFSHANQGWNCLHRNEPRKAQEHFREALRLEPDLEYARNGMLEALKARNPVYRGMLAYFLWISTQRTRIQWATVIGIFFGGQLIQFLSQHVPQLSWLWWPLLFLFFAFVYLTWTARPMFNLLLRFDRFGRHVLSRDQRIATNWFGPVFFAAAGCAIWWACGAGDAGKISTFMLAALSICVAATFLRDGRNRLILAGITGLLALVGGGSFALLWNGYEQGGELLMVFAVGVVAFQVLANVLH